MKTRARTRNRVSVNAAIVWAAFALTAARIPAQETSAEVRLHAPVQQVEMILRDLHASSAGRLPIVEGFTAPLEHPAERYQRAYYQYSVKTVPAAAGETVVRVTARITAWYAAEEPSRSGYCVLRSNGRLENDLIERLQEALPGDHTAPPPGSESSRLPRSLPAARQATAPKKPLAPASPVAAGSASVFRVPSPFAAPDPNRVEAPASPAETGRIRQLSEQVHNLETILQNQSRPADLAAVHNSGTPVWERPARDARVLFLAETEDEFRVIKELGSWVNVQISGISRGWIERSQLEMPGSSVSRGQPSESTAPGAAVAEQVHAETSLFPGDWSPLRGKTVRIVWVQGREPSVPAKRWTTARDYFRKHLAEVSGSGGGVEGIVVVFDASDGGMAAATLASLRHWVAGDLSDEAFRKQCWLNPSDAF